MSANINKPSVDTSLALDGQIIGNYKIEKTIGQGTYGKVKLAYHINTCVKYAIKIIEKAQLSNNKQIARLQREIRFLKLLHHPHIVKVFDVIEVSDTIFIAMEYEAGGELFDYIVAHKRVKEKEARSFFRMVLSAVDYCHQNSVIHRDLKPENLLLDENKCIKIIDFGFGNNFTFDGLLDTFCGSPFYAAPEMILGKKYEGPEVDMWSLGVILFALLCGHLPFDDDNIKELYKKIASGTYTCPDYLLPNARHLISRLITVDPRERATLEEVLSHQWVNEGYDSPPPNYVPERPVIKDFSLLSKEIVNRILAFGYRIEDVEKAFGPDSNHSKPNPVRATYFLLLEMLQREELKLRLERKSSLSSNLLQQNNTPLQKVKALPGKYTSMSTNNIGQGVSLSKIDENCDNNLSERELISQDNKQDQKQSTIGPSKIENHNSFNNITKVTNSANAQQKNKVQLQQPEKHIGNNRPYVSMQLLTTKENRRLSTPEPNENVKVTNYSPVTPNSAPPNYPLPPIPVFKSKKRQVEQVKSDAASVTVNTNLEEPSGSDRPDPKYNNFIKESQPQNKEKATVVKKDEANTSSQIVNKNSKVTTTLKDQSTSESGTGDIYHSSRRLSMPLNQQSNLPRRASIVKMKEELRAVSGWFLNVSTTSSKSPNEILKEVTRVLEQNCVAFEVEGFIVMCEANVDLLLVNNAQQSQKEAFNSEFNDNSSLNEADSNAIPVESNNKNNSAPINIQGKKSILTFQIEICKVPKMNLYGLNFKRIGGGVWNYKK
ncbi:Map microtubule affinity-regulating kinase, partial [Lobulomyces angularis]